MPSAACHAGPLYAASLLVPHKEKHARHLQGVLCTNESVLVMASEMLSATRKVFIYVFF